MFRKEFFSNLKDFERILLNQKTNYTAILETPKETEKGNVLYKRSYSWPKTKYGNWNIDTSGMGFYSYFNSLLSIGEFYDEYFANNIWRAMTHEAIVNFDWTLSYQDKNGINTTYDSPNPKRMESFIHVAGRVFDDLKQYRKEHWREWQRTGEEWNETVRNYRRYKQSLYKDGKLKFFIRGFCGSADIKTVRKCFAVKPSPRFECRN
mgnify:CR=1 FL=1